jgi:hypothetical protein
MTILTDDPDWSPRLYEARALAIRFAAKHGRWQDGGEPCRVAERRGLRVTYHPQRSPRRLTIDNSGPSTDPFERVLCIEWNERDAWRMAIETYRPGRWESRLRTTVDPKPWLRRWRALAMFTAAA